MLPLCLGREREWLGWGSGRQADVGRPRGCSSPSPASRPGAPICVRAAGTPFQRRPAVGGAGHHVTGSVTRPKGLPVGHPERKGSLPGQTRPDPTTLGSRASAYAWDPAPPRSQATVIPWGRLAETTGHDRLAELPIVWAGCFSQVPDVALSTPASCLLPV